MSYGKHSGNDVRCGEEIAEYMLHRERFHIAPLTKDIAIIKAAIGMARFTLGLSYHVHVFGLSQGKPAIILYTGQYYQYKSDGLVGFYGDPIIALDLAKATDREIFVAIEQIDCNYESALKAVEKGNRYIRKNNDWMLKRLASRLGRANPVANVCQ
jgi:polysaccharide pyruvyl transferase WcaK-like protein